MNSLINQLKQRRITLGLKQHDMLLQVGISRQQYQRLEASGNPRLDTLELIARGLKSEIVLFPARPLRRPVFLAGSAQFRFLVLWR